MGFSNPDKNLFSFADTWIVDLRASHGSVANHCKGVLISDKHILTSKECSWLKDRKLGVRIIVRFPQDPQLFSREATLQHLSPERTILHDGQIKVTYGVAIFQLKHSVKDVYENFQPICIKSETSKTSVGTNNINKASQSVVFNSGQKMALRAFYFIWALTKALTYYYINRSQRHLLVAIENNRFGGPINEKDPFCCPTHVFMLFLDELAQEKNI